MTGTHTYAEIKSQPTVWQDALAIFQAQADQLSQRVLAQWGVR